MDNSGSKTRMRLRGIVALGLALRLFVVWITARSKSPAWFFAEATELGRLANSLVGGHGLSNPFGGATGPSAFLAPGYPALVAAVFALFHPYSMASAVALMLLQAVFGAATIAILMLLTRRCFGTSAANVAGLICALSPPLIWLPVVFWETSLSGLLVCSLLAMTLYAVDRQTLPVWVAFGVCSAIGLLVNPSLLTLIACCFGWAVYRMKAKQLGGLWVASVVCLVLFSPWPIRNYRVMHAFIPFRSNMGYELWQGNRPGGDGFFDPKLHMNNNRDEFERYEELGELGYMSEKAKLGKAAIASQPLRFVRHSVKRALYFWTGVGPESSGLMVLYSCLTLAGGLSGIYMLICRKDAMIGLLVAPLLLFPLPYYLTHPDFRFRLVVDPLLIALTSYAIGSAMQSRERHEGTVPVTQR